MRRTVLILLTLALAGCSSGTPKPEPTTIGGLQTFTEDPKPRHVKGHVTYDHTPPAGGQHADFWLKCAVYDAPVPNEVAVHSEEHGAVWLTYLPGEDPAPLRALYDGNKEYVLVSPYPDQPGKFMASTWGAQLSVDSGDDPRLKQFVDTYASGGQGGEKGAPCVAGGLTPAEAEAKIAEASS